MGGQAPQVVLLLQLRPLRRHGVWVPQQGLVALARPGRQHARGRGRGDPLGVPLQLRHPGRRAQHRPQEGPLRAEEVADGRRRHGREGGGARAAARRLAGQARGLSVPRP